MTMSLVTLLAGLNLTVELTAQHLPNLRFVRFRELFSLLFITPASIALLFRVIWALERGRPDAKWLMTLFVASGAFLAVSMGVHEPINALRAAVGESELAAAAESLWFWDDFFSHVVFFTGYVGISLILIWSQVRNPLAKPINFFTGAIFGICALVGGLGIFYSLVHGGRIRVDLAVIAGVLIAAELLRRRKSFAILPIALTIEGAYLLALVLLVAHRLYRMFSAG